jgi:hypothetical protein
MPMLPRLVIVDPLFDKAYRLRQALGPEWMVDVIAGTPAQLWQRPQLSAIHVSLPMAEPWGARPVLEQAQIFETSQLERDQGLPDHVIAGVAVAPDDERTNAELTELAVTKVLEVVSQFNGEHPDKPIDSIGVFSEHLLLHETGVEDAAAAIKRALSNAASNDGEPIPPAEMAAFLDLALKLGLEGAERQVSIWSPDPVHVSRLRDAYVARANLLVELRDPPSLDAREIDRWYVGPQPGDRFWPPLREALEEEDWSFEDIQTLDLASSKIVARMSPPLAREFNTRGLVLGHVQSGKTSNFTSVIAKAADVGYRFFIVLSGVHNALRRQTQERLDSDLVRRHPEYWMSLTNADEDFSPPAAGATNYLSEVGQRYVLAVVKKNSTRLSYLSQWLSGADPRVLAECPVLIIDDEADQAGIGTTRANEQIRDLLSRLPKVTYIGYTATPFANLLIDPAEHDLYPADFILDLPQSREHFGTEVIFGRDAVEGEDDSSTPLDGYDMVREVPIKELPNLRLAPKQSLTDFEPAITSSLRNAVLYFWLATAARRVRGTGTPHSTMLLHTSMRIGVHQAFRDPLDDLRAQIVRELASEDPALDTELRDLWEAEVGRVPADDFGEAATTYNDLQPHLADVVAETRVILDNSWSPVRLSYDDDNPVVAIAVGGNTLSRGLTLRGLVVSYFVRAASAYDTLLQMGRWFGYREGYADLPRVWMTDELRRWFRHLATVETEIRRDIRRYEEENLTPLDFGVRIRTHPALAITAAAKMKDARTAYASYSGRRVQTRYFFTDSEDWLASNSDAARRLVSDAVATGAETDRLASGDVIIRGAPVDVVLRFLDRYEVHPEAFDLDRDVVTGYINKQVENGNLALWNIAMINGADDPSSGEFSFADGVMVNKVRRSKLKDPEATYADIKTLMSKEDRVVDLRKVEPAMARRLTERALVEARGPSDPPLIALYAIDRYSRPDPANEERRAPLNALDDVIGIGLVFPSGLPGDSAVSYKSADLSRLGLTEADVEEGIDEDPDLREAA